MQTELARPRVAAAIVLLALVPSVTFAGEPALGVRFAPRDWAWAFEARPPGLGYRGAEPYYDVMVHAMAFVNATAGAVTFESATLEVLRGGQVVQTQLVAAADVTRDVALAGQLRAAGFGQALDVLFSAGELLDGVQLSAGLEMAPGSAALASQYYLTLRGLPEAIRVRVRARDGQGKPVEGEGRLEVRAFEPTTRYRFPLEAGAWYVSSYPGIKGHHRWTASTEFALDIIAVDGNGNATSSSRPPFAIESWDEYYAYGKKVLATADGVVVRVVGTEEFPLETWRRREGESRADYGRRQGQMQMQRFLEEGSDTLTVAAGNHVVIQHADGVFSFYGHLAYGSIRVKVGDRVAAGQHIAGVGGTGEVPWVHLHFQLNDTATSLFGHSLPVTFSDARVNHPEAELVPEMFEPGYFVVAGEPAPAKRQGTD